MTKYKIKLRRDSLTHGQIQRHKNFDSLYSATNEDKPKFPILRLLAILLGIGLVIAMIIMGISRISDNKKEIERQKSETVFEEDF
ncbi:hypothetical protein [Reichenbachiella versicolor]|uniref:hypothetical protein n=1 Tax=Reichenbachiella versicolor TaxID=1821036 RepID=UPI000D6DFC61|nr:hypothetical protein [Reichenbachiella versicolor]